jgi:hypothetical protein
MRFGKSLHARRGRRRARRQESPASHSEDACRRPSEEMAAGDALLAEVRLAVEWTSHRVGRRLIFSAIPMMQGHELALCHRARGRCPHDCASPIRRPRAQCTWRFHGIRQSAKNPSHSSTEAEARDPLRHTRELSFRGEETPPRAQVSSTFNQDLTGNTHPECPSLNGGVPRRFRANADGGKSWPECKLRAVLNLRRKSSGYSRWQFQSAYEILRRQEIRQLKNKARS